MCTEVWPGLGTVTVDNSMLELGTNCCSTSAVQRASLCLVAGLASSPCAGLGKTSSGLLCDTFGRS